MTYLRLWVRESFESGLIESKDNSENIKNHPLDNQEV